MSDHEHTYGDDGTCTNCGQPHEAMVTDPVNLPPVEPAEGQVAVPAEHPEA